MDKDPLYGLPCGISSILPDETFFCRLISKENLSYCIHKSLLNSKRLFKMIRNYNDSYHRSQNNHDYLSFCIVKTIFTTDSTKHYIYLEDLGK